MNDRNILIVSAVFPPEPVVSARLSSDIYCELINLNCRVKVFHPKPSRPKGFVFDGSIAYKDNEIISNSYVCPQSSLIGRFLESFSFGKAAAQYVGRFYKEIGVIYANTWPLFGQYYLIKTAKKYNIPCIIHVQDIYPESYCQKLPKLLGGILYKMFLPIDKYVLKYAMGVIAISPTMIHYLSESRGVDEMKFMLVRNWQNDRAYIETYTPLKEKNRVCEIMYLGSINPTANVPLIIDAISDLNNNKYHLSVIGDGPEKEHCIEIARYLDLNVTFDTVMPEQVASKQAKADILVLCLKKGVAKTATPSKLTAYMLTGRPIIASVDLDSDCANIIRESGCGLVVEPENAKALAVAIENINGKNVDEQRAMGKKAYDYALENLSKQKNLKKLVNVILNTRNDRN